MNHPSKKYIHFQENVSLLVSFRECFAFNRSFPRKLPAECQLLADVKPAFCPKAVCLATKIPRQKKSIHLTWCFVQSNHPDIHQISLCQKTGNCFFQPKRPEFGLQKRKKKTFEDSLGLWQSMSPSYLKHHLQRSKHPKMINFSRKTHGFVGYHHFRKHPFR